MNSQHYKGHLIRLVPSMEGYMWACQYLITRADNSEMDGFPDGNTYASRELAESAALAKAKALVDESELTKDPQH